MRPAGRHVTHVPRMGRFGLSYTRSTAPQITNPEYSTTAFLNGLKQVDGWHNLPTGPRPGPFSYLPPGAAGGQPAARAANSAARIAATGAGTPVNCSNWPTAWASSRSRPETTRPPAATAAVASGVGHGS